MKLTQIVEKMRAQQAKIPEEIKEELRLDHLMGEIRDDE